MLNQQAHTDQDESALAKSVTLGFEAPSDPSADFKPYLQRILLVFHQTKGTAENAALRNTVDNLENQLGR